MPDATAGVIGGSALLGGAMQASAGKEAAEIQAQVAREQLAAQQAIFRETQTNLLPFRTITRPEQGYTPATTLVDPGRGAALQLANLLNLPIGTDAFGQPVYDQNRGAVLAQLEQDPLYQAKVRQGEQALLQQASATGGLRGGNVQAALAQFRPQMLSQEISNRIAQLAGITEAGSEQRFRELSAAQAAAAGGAQAGAQLSGQLGQTFGALAKAQGQEALSGGMGTAGQFISSIPSMIGTYQGLTGRNLFASTPSAGTMMASGGVMV